MSTASATGTPESLSLHLAELDAGERGFVLARLATAGASDDPLDAPLAGAAGRRCAAVLECVAALPRAERLRLMDALGREVLGAIPAGIEHVHPDTLRPLLQRESSATLGFLVGDDVPGVVRETAAVVLAGRATEEATTDRPDGGAEAAQEVRRAVLAPVIPVAARPASAGPTLRRGLALAAMDPESLLSEVTRAGAELLGISLQGSERTHVDHAAALAGPPWAEHIRRAALRAGLDAAEGGQPWTRKRARDLMAATGPAGTPLETLRRLGAAALGTGLRDDPRLVPAIAQRLSTELAHRLRASAGL